jgi:hypothetical protein
MGNSIVVGLDIGTTKIACFVGKQNDHGKITQDEFDGLCLKADELSRMLYMMIKNLSS